MKLIVGDEPHYLLIMHSLGKYHTPELSQILKDDKLPEGLQKIRPHRSGMSVQNKIYSIHNIGLPLLLVFPHLILGYQGVIFFINIITALIVTNIFLFSLEISKNKWGSFFTALLLGITCPIGFYSRCIYPDTIAALFILYSYRIIRNRETNLVKVLLASIGIAYLSWLHVKFTLIWVTLLIFFLFSAKSNLKNFLTITTISLFSAFLLAIFFYHAYGSILPSAPYGKANPPLSKFLFRGLPGLLFDINHGLFPLSPYFFLLIPGIVYMFRKDKNELGKISALVLPSLFIFASHWMWWGGPCPAGRFLLPLIPLITPLLTYSFQNLHTPRMKALIIGLVSFSIYIGYLSFKFPETLTIHKHIGSKTFIGIEAFPPFPIFTWLRTQEVPIKVWIKFLFWLIPCIFLFRTAFFQRKSLLNKPYFSLSGVILFLFLPGLYSIFFSSLFTPSLCSSNLTLPQMNYYLHQFAKPLMRAGVDPKFIHQKIHPPIILTTLLEYNRSFETLHYPISPEGKYLVTGPYIYLYPVKYTVSYFFQSVGKEIKYMGVVDISTHRGRKELAKQMVKTTTTPSFQVITLSVFPLEIEADAEFRFKLTDHTTGIIRYILIRTIIGMAQKT